MSDGELPAHLRAWLAARHVRTWLAMRRPSVRAWLAREGPRLAAEAQRLREALERGEALESLGCHQLTSSRSIGGPQPPASDSSAAPRHHPMPELLTQE